VDPRGELKEARLFLGRNMAEGELWHLAGGCAAVYSARAPDVPDGPNEDAAALVPTAVGGVVIAVADGMGGGPAGEQAASLAVRALQRSVADGGPVRTAILNGFEAANHEVLALGGGAAATLAAVEIEGDSARPYHTGDSLILVVGQRGKRKHQTVPHSPVGYGVEAGLIDEAEALHHEDLHLVSNLIGSAEMRIEVGPRIPLASRDTLLIASDGLTDNLAIAEIVERVRKGSLREVMRSLAAEVEVRMHHPAEGRPSKPDDLTFVAFRRLRPGRGV